MPKLIHYQYRRAGKPAVVYKEWLILDRPDAKVLLLENYEGAEVRVAESSVLDSGAPIVWFVFPETWHDIGRFHLANQTFTGWYTNLCTPVDFHDDSWSSSDLFLDLWTPTNGQSVWLDEDEFNAAVKAGRLDATTKKRVLAERALVEARVKLGDWPPAIAREIDLRRARELKQY